VDSVVHGSKKETRWRLGNKGVPATQQDRNVMVPMQKHELFLVNDNEKGISKFGDLAQHKEHAPQSCGTTANHRFRIQAELSPESIVV